MAHVLNTCDPDTYANAHGLSIWENAMSTEIESLLKNQTWDVLPRPYGNNVVKSQLVYKTNFTS